MPKSSLHYLLLTLANRGYLEQTGRQGGYTPGPAFLEIAQRVVNPEGSRSVAARIIHDIGTTLNEATAYYELRGDAAEVLLLESPRQPLQISLVIGTLAPLHAGAAGKALLANLPEEEIDEFLARATLTQLTPHTITDPAKLKEELAEIRRTNFAMAREEHIAGVIGTAIPLKHGAKIVGAITVGVPTVRYTPEMAERVHEQLSLAAARFQREAAPARLKRRK